MICYGKYQQFIDIYTNKIYKNAKYAPLVCGGADIEGLPQVQAQSLKFEGI